MSKLKVLHITTSLKVGGAESLLFDILRSIDKDIFENYVIYFHHGLNVERIKRLGIPVYQIRGLFFRYDPIFFLRLFFLIKKIGPDCIHSLLWSANFFSSIVAKLLNIPIFCVLHSAWNLGSSYDSKLRLFLDKIVFSFTDKIVCVSQNISDIFKSKYPLMGQKIFIIKNGIDCQYIIDKGLELKKERKDFGIKETDFVVGSVGRLVEVKNQHFLIEIISLLSKKYDNLKLVLVGDGPLKKILELKVRSLLLEDRVIFIGFEQAYGFYPLFDCFVLCSNQEGLSIALLEAMSFSVPCITTGDEHEVIISGKNGYLSKVDVFDLANRIEMLYKDLNLAREIGENGKKTVLCSFSLKAMIDSYQKVCKSLCDNKKK